MSTEPTPPPGPKPQLPPASKPSLPQAPKLSLAGGAPTTAKPTFKQPDTGGDPFATEHTGSRTAEPVAPALPRPPSIGTPAAAAATAPISAVHATHAPASTTRPVTHAALVPVEEETPKFAGLLAGLGFAASLAGAVMLFLELKPTL